MSTKLILAAAAAAVAFAFYRRKAGNLRFLLFWVLPFAVFLFGGNKDVRYIAPILPAVGAPQLNALSACRPQHCSQIESESC